MEFRPPTRLQRTTLADGTEVSTVNLQSAAMDAMQYETCVFYPTGDSNVVSRYATEAEALAGHRFFVEHEHAHPTYSYHYYSGLHSVKGE